MSSMAGHADHTDVGAYALGLLEEPDRRAFEAHLATCASCMAELRELSGTAAALHDVKSMAPPPPPPAQPFPEQDRPPAEVIDLMRRTKRAERRRRRGTYVIGTVAAGTLLATGVVLGGAFADEGGGTGNEHQGHGSPAQALVIWGERHSASNPQTGVSGLVGLENKQWGTHVGLELKGVKGPLLCHLEAVSKTGERTVVTGWKVPPKGYGVPGSPNPLITHGGTAINRADLARFDVVVDGADGRTLLSIPV